MLGSLGHPSIWIRHQGPEQRHGIIPVNGANASTGVKVTDPVLGEVFRCQIGDGFTACPHASAGRLEAGPLTIRCAVADGGR